MWWLGTTSRALGHADRALQLGADGEHGAAGAERQRAAARARSRATGAAAAAGRAPARTTESSQRMWIGRSWVSSPSTSGPRRATASSSSWAIGSSLRLPLVITSGRPTPAQQQVVERAVRQEQPSSGSPGATPSATGASGRRGASTIGPAGRGQRLGGRRRRARTAASRRVEVGHHHRERLVVACLAPAQLGDRGVVGGVDGEVVAADALDRHDPPGAERVDGGVERRRARRPARSPSASRHASCGPQAGQALGWAWKRRSAGSSYSAWQAGHIVKPAIVVAGRS